MNLSELNIDLWKALRSFGVSEEAVAAAKFELAPIAHADFTCAAAFLLAKSFQRPPRVVAEQIVAQLKKKPADLKEIACLEVVGAGYINVTLSIAALWSQTKDVSQSMPAQRRHAPVVIDYSSPNVAKPMGIGHLRSTIIGESLARIHEWLGFRVVRLNHPGDWGTQFGKLIVMIKDTKSPVKSIQGLVALYITFHEKAKAEPVLEDRAREETKKLQQGDKTNRALWKKIVTVSYKEFHRVYKQFGIRFDAIMGESSYNSALTRVVEQALGSGVAKQSQGAVIIPFDDLATPMVIQKSDGAYLYATTDIAAVAHRMKKYHPERILYVVGHEQSLHFEQLKRAVEKLGIAPQSTVEHIKFGLMLGRDRKKLSTRSGTGGGLQEVLDEAIGRAQTVLNERSQKTAPDLSLRERERIAQVIGLGSVIYNDLSQNRAHDIIVDWDRMMSFTGSSAPYLQYSVVRINSILKKLPNKGSKTILLDGMHARERELLRLLIRFRSTVEEAGRMREPHRVAEYCATLAASFHRLYEEVPVLNSQNADQRRRAELLARVAATLTQGLWLLGIQTPKRM